MIYSVGFSAPFLETIADYLISQQSVFALSEWTIYVPTSGARRILSDLLLKKIIRKTFIMPRILSLGDLDPEEVVLSFPEECRDPSLFSAVISTYRRKLLLASLINKFQYADVPISFDQALIWAESLLSFIDEMRTEGIDLKALEKLPFPGGGQAEHCDKIRQFLRLLAEHWDKILEEEKCVESVVWQRELIRAHASFLAKNQTKNPVMIAGSMGTIASTRHLIKAIDHLKNGVVVLSGFQKEVSEEFLSPHHPQFLLRQLLDKIGKNPEKVKELDIAKIKKDSSCLIDIFDGAIKSKESSFYALNNLSYAEASDQGEESRLVAVAIRKALEDGKKKILCVSPDHKLLHRISTELRLWSLSAFRQRKPLIETRTGSFLHLISLWFSTPFPVIPMVSTFKHEAVKKKKEIWCLFEKYGLRGCRGALSFSAINYLFERGIKEIDFDKEEKLRSFYKDLQNLFLSFEEGDSLGFYLDKIEIIMQWLLESEQSMEELFLEIEPETATEFHLLWRDLRKSSTLSIDHPKQVSNVFFNFLRNHPIVLSPQERDESILFMSPVEARFVEADFKILAGLNEGIWPLETKNDPFFSPSMRNQLGLSCLEERVGQSAHDFLSFLCGEGSVLLTRSLMVNGVPSVPSRFLSYLSLFLERHGQKLPRYEELTLWAKNLIITSPSKSMLPPTPLPPVSCRPKKMSITDVDLLLRDPYSIYAKYILRLRSLEPLILKNKARFFGLFVHHFLHQWKLDSSSFLEGSHDKEKFLFELYLGPIDRSRFWWEKFLILWPWAKEQQTLKNTLTEIKGEIVFAKGAHLFTLFGRADRIDWDEKGAILIDYKTGAPPSSSDLKKGKASQILLQALIFLRGGFKGIPASIRLEDLQYWGLLSEEIISLKREDFTALIKQVEKNLEDLFDLFSKKETPYLSYPKGVSRSGDYDHLARIQEWMISG